MTRVRVRAQVWLREVQVPSTTSGIACSSERGTVRAKMAGDRTHAHGPLVECECGNADPHDRDRDEVGVRERECGRPQGAEARTAVAAEGTGKER